MTSRAKQGGGFQDWGQLRDHLIEQFGNSPHPETEQDIIDAYQLHPGALEAAASAVVLDVQAGTARSGWGVLRARATKMLTPVANPNRGDSINRETAIGRAEQWMRAAGLHFDEESEILLELFDGGRLSAYAQTSLISTEPDDGPPWMLAPITGDAALAERMIALYRELRPTGIRLETEAQEAADKWKHQHSALANSDETPKKPAAIASHSSTSQRTESSPSSTSPKPPTTGLPSPKATPPSNQPSGSRTPSPASAHEPTAHRIPANQPADLRANQEARPGTGQQPMHELRSEKAPDRASHPADHAGRISDRPGEHDHALQDLPHGGTSTAVIDALTPSPASPTEPANDDLPL